MKRIGKVEYDLTNGGLFPEWGGIGINWSRKRDRKRNASSRTTGREKSHGKASTFARYCAKSSRAHKHRDYPSQVAKWKAKNA